MLSRKSRKIRNKKQFKKRQKNVSKVISGGDGDETRSRNRLISSEAVKDLKFENLETTLRLTQNEFKVYNQLWVEILDMSYDKQIPDEAWVDLDKTSYTRHGQRWVVAVTEPLLVNFSVASGLSKLLIGDIISFLKQVDDGLTDKFHKREFFTFLKLVAIVQANVDITNARFTINSLQRLTKLPIIGSSTSG